MLFILGWDVYLGWSRVVFSQDFRSDTRKTLLRMQTLSSVEKVRGHVSYLIAAGYTQQRWTRKSFALTLTSILPGAMGGRAFNQWHPFWDMAFITLTLPNHDPRVTKRNSTLPKREFSLHPSGSGQKVWPWTALSISVDLLYLRKGIHLAKWTSRTLWPDKWTCLIVQIIILDLLI